jgi:hypothetical protein
MSADSYKPQTGLSPAQIAVPPKPAMTNQPLPSGVPVERREAGAINSPNTGAGGYIGKR